MPRSNWAQGPQLLTPGTVNKPEHLKPMLCNKTSHYGKKPTHHNGEDMLLATTRETHVQQGDPMQSKHKKIMSFKKLKTKDKRTINNSF